MKQLFIKHAKWCYGLSAALLLCGAVMCILGEHEDLGTWVAIAGIGLAINVADANGQLTDLKKHKD